jgi:hypothetical protein
MPRYWKRNGRRELRIIIRKDCYKIDDEYLHLPKGLKLKYKGKLRWKGSREGWKLSTMMWMKFGGALWRLKSRSPR